MDFTLKHKTPMKSQLELDLENLEYRLRIQQGWVEKTEAEIENIKELIKKEEDKK